MDQIHGKEGPGPAPGQRSVEPANAMEVEAVQRAITTPGLRKIADQLFAPKTPEQEIQELEAARDLGADAVLMFFKVAESDRQMFKAQASSIYSWAAEQQGVQSHHDAMLLIRRISANIGRSAFGQNRLQQFFMWCMFGGNPKEYISTGAK